MDFPKSVTIGNTEVQVSRWTKGGHDRLYLSAHGQGKACWDLNAKTWVRQHGEFGSRFKVALMQALGLSY